MIGAFFSGDEKATLMGFRSSFESLGQSIMTLVAGFLLFLGWKGTFLVYLIAVPILILFVLFVPKTSNDEAVKQESSSSNSGRQSVNGPIILISVFLFAVVVAYIGLTVRFPSIVTTHKFGTMEESSRILSIMTFCGMLMGFLFGFINKALRKHTLTVGIILMAIGCLTVFFAPNFVVLSAGALIAGIAYPIMVAYTFNLISDVCPANSSTLCTSIVLVGCNLGAFLAPYGLTAFTALIDPSSLTIPFLVYGIILIIIAVGYAVVSSARSK